MRLNVLPALNISLREYFNRIQNNFIELYRKVDSNEQGYTGISAEVITSGTMSDDRLSNNVARVQDIRDAIDQLNISNPSIVIGSGDFPNTEGLPENTIYIRYE